jgi:hypothetical protein
MLLAELDMRSIADHLLIFDYDGVLQCRRYSIEELFEQANLQHSQSLQSCFRQLEAEYLTKPRAWTSSIRSGSGGRQLAMRRGGRRGRLAGYGARWFRRCVGVDASAVPALTAAPATPPYAGCSEPGRLAGRFTRADHGPRDVLHTRHGQWDKEHGDARNFAGTGQRHDAARRPPLARERGRGGCARCRRRQRPQRVRSCQAPRQEAAQAAQRSTAAGQEQRDRGLGARPGPGRERPGPRRRQVQVASRVLSRRRVPLAKGVQVAGRWPHPQVNPTSSRKAHCAAGRTRPQPTRAAVPAFQPCSTLRDT